MDGRFQAGNANASGWRGLFTVIRSLSSSTNPTPIWIAAIAEVRGRGAIVVAVAHRPSLLESVDLVLLMKDGRAVAFGAKDKLVGHLLPDRRRENADGGAIAATR